MLHRFKDLLKRFQRDERGAFMVLFGVLAIVLIATSGAVVDFTQIEQARTRAQIALDAAALGLQPHVFDTSPTWTVTDFKREAGLLLTERLADSRITATVENATINVRNGQLILEARIIVPTNFVSLVGVPNVSARLVAEATRKRLNLEVAMVLDNSGSMLSSNRMTRLKEAAALAADILFDYKDSQPNVSIGIVPFAQFVNVGADNRYASWMIPQSGVSPMSTYGNGTVPYSSLHFDKDNNDTNTFKEQVSRWDLYDGFASGSWTGCVEARFGGFDTTDEIPNNAVPATMFFPVFAQDGAPGNNYVNDTNPNCPIEPKWIWVQEKNTCSTNTTNSSTFETAACSGSPKDTYTVINQDNVTVEGPESQPANGDASIYYNTLKGCSDSVTSVRTSTSPNRYRLTRTRTCTYTYSTKEFQERLCKYKDATWTNSHGPNTTNCPIPMLPLTNQRAEVKAKITAMNPPSSATTNIAQGAIWGYHMLSPSEPLTEGRAYDEAISKIMIVMTDGENNADYAPYSGSTTGFGNDQYSAWGYRWDKRLLTETTIPKDSVATDAQFTAEIDRRTKLACANAKAGLNGSSTQKIKVYTIGLAAPSGLQQMLKDCASPDEVINGKTVRYWYFPSQASDLLNVFREIAEQLSELRLAQ